MRRGIGSLLSTLTMSGPEKLQLELGLIEKAKVPLGLVFGDYEVETMITAYVVQRFSILLI